MPLQLTVVGSTKPWATGLMVMKIRVLKKIKDNSVLQKSTWLK